MPKEGRSGYQKPSLFATPPLENSEEVIDELYKVSLVQEELFHQIVQELEGIRLAEGKSKTAFYYKQLKIAPNRIHKLVGEDIHKFFLTDIVWYLYRAGRKMTITFEDWDQD